MPLLGHWPELFVVLLIGLLVFGPKRMIEMGSTVGKAVREMRDSLKDVPGMGGSGLHSLLDLDEPRTTPFVSTNGTVSPIAATTRPDVVAASAVTPTETSSPPSATPLTATEEVIDGTIDHVIDVPED